jgi:hypothetical protein
VASPVMGTIMYSTTGILTAIYELAETLITIFPNPVKPGDYIFCDKDFKKAKLFTVLGRSISLTIDSKGLKIPSDLDSGIYILQLENGEGIRSSNKVLVE